MSTALNRALAVTATTLAMVTLGAGSASAGEILGNGDRVFPNHTHPGKSHCAFSGQNDEYHEINTSYPRVQSFGQIVAEVGPIGGIPGTECNPSGG